MVDGKVLWVGGMNRLEREKLCHSSELGRKKSVWLCVNSRALIVALASNQAFPEEEPVNRLPTLFDVLIIY